MPKSLSRFIHTKPALIHLIEMLLAIRAIFFIGWRYQCPCCGWRIREFTKGGTSIRKRPLGYCPRCNAKGAIEGIGYT